jgi:hypothetical protein
LGEEEGEEEQGPGKDVLLCVLARVDVGAYIEGAT